MTASMIVGIVPLIPSWKLNNLKRDNTNIVDTEGLFVLFFKKTICNKKIFINRSTFKLVTYSISIVILDHNINEVGAVKCLIPKISFFSLFVE